MLGVEDFFLLIPLYVEFPTLARVRAIFRIAIRPIRLCRGRLFYVGAGAIRRSEPLTGPKGGFWSLSFCISTHNQCDGASTSAGWGSEAEGTVPGRVWPSRLPRRLPEARKPPFYGHFRGLAHTHGREVGFGVVTNSNHWAIWPI